MATGLVRVRSPLLAESRLISFPPATEMFQFTGFASSTYGFSGGSPCKGGVSPFGHPRIKACSQLPEAFRSVPRPSSPLGAKASTRCPSSLERYFHVPSQGQGRSPGSHTLPTPDHVSAKTTRTVPQPPQTGRGACRERVCQYV